MMNMYQFGKNTYQFDKITIRFATLCSIGGCLQVFRQPDFFCVFFFGLSPSRQVARKKNAVSEKSSVIIDYSDQDGTSKIL